MTCEEKKLCAKKTKVIYNFHDYYGKVSLKVRNGSTRVCPKPKPPPFKTKTNPTTSRSQRRNHLKKK